MDVSMSSPGGIGKTTGSRGIGLGRILQLSHLHYLAVTMNQVSSDDEEPGRLKAETDESNHLR
jgi:hypothetical protein